MYNFNGCELVKNTYFGYCGKNSLFERDVFGSVENSELRSGQLLIQLEPILPSWS